MRDTCRTGIWKKPRLPRGWQRKGECEVCIESYAGSMVRIGTICLNASDWQRAATFWSAALGYAPHPEAPDVLVPPGNDGPALGLYERDRTHLDLYTADKAEQLAEIERLISLGAELVPDWPYPDDADFVVLRDPEGNLFCVVAQD